MGRLRTAAIAVVIAAVAATAAGCGSGSNGTKTSASTSGAATPSASGKAGTLTVASSQGIPQLDPYKILFSFEQVLYPLLWNSLTTYTATTGSRVEPSLATSWTVSKDAKTYTFHIRSGVDFSNGTPLTAGDVAKDFQRALNPTTKFIWAFLFPKVTSEKAVNNSTVKFTLATPSAVFPDLLTKVPIVDPNAVAEIQKDPIGTGPYLLKSFVPNGNVSLVPNPKYWGTKPKLSKLTIVRAQDNTSAVLGLKSGSIDSIWSVPWTDAKSLTSSGSGISIITSPAPSAAIIIETDNTSAPFNNVKARQALAYAVDRPTIVQSVYDGKVTAAITNQPVPPTEPYFDSSLPKYNYNIQKAKQLFAEAGVKSGTTFTFWTTAGEYDEWTTAGEILAADLAKIGINLKIERNEPNTWAAKFAPAGKKWPDLLVPNFYSGFSSNVVPGFWEPGINESNFNDPAYNAAVGQAEAALTPAAQKSAYAKVEQIFNQQAPVVIMAYGSWPVAVTSRVHGVWEDPATEIHFEDASTS